MKLAYIPSPGVMRLPSEENVTLGRGNPLTLQCRVTFSPSLKQGRERVRPLTETGAEG